MYEDSWMEEFVAKAAPRLQNYFEADLNSQPVALSELLQRLRDSEDLELPLAA